MRSNIVDATGRRGSHGPYSQPRELTLKAEVYDHVGERWVRLTTEGLGAKIVENIRWSEWLRLTRRAAEDSASLDIEHDRLLSGEPRPNSPEDLGQRSTG